MYSGSLYPDLSVREEITIQSPPAVVAQVCVEVLGELVEITAVDRTTGRIAGKWSSVVGWLGSLRGVIEVRISSDGDVTHLAIAAQQTGKALKKGRDAQDMVVKFLRGVQQHPKLAGKTTLGW